VREVPFFGERLKGHVARGLDFLSLLNDREEGFFRQLSGGCSRLAFWGYLCELPSPVYGSQHAVFRDSLAEPPIHQFPTRVTHMVFLRFCFIGSCPFA
jgi:hypothetical protein